MQHKKIRTYSNDEVLVSERRKQIVKAATKLYLKKGYDHTNTRELCDVLGMSKGTLYHYVGTKTDILFLVFQFALADQKKIIERMATKTKDLSCTDAMKESMRIYFSNVDEMQDMYNFINHAIVLLPKEDRPIIFESEEIMVDYFNDLIERGMKNNEFYTDNSKLVAHGIVLAANAWAHRRWYIRRFYTFEEYLTCETDQILKGLTVKDPCI